MNLDQIRSLPDGPVPQPFTVQLKEIKAMPQGNRPAKVKLTDSSVGQFATVLWRPEVPLVVDAWYEVTPGQDNQGREQVRVATESLPDGSRTWKQLSIDGKSIRGPLPGPRAVPQPSAQAQLPAPHLGGFTGGTTQGPRKKPTDRDYIQWLAVMASRVAQIEELGKDPQAIQAACATAFIAVNRGDLEMTFGQGLSGLEATQPQSAPPPSAYSDDDIPW